MRCDKCGRDIPKGQAIESTRSEQTNPPGIMGARTSTVPERLCPECVRKRGALVTTLMALLLVVMGLVFFSLLWGW